LTSRPARGQGPNYDYCRADQNYLPQAQAVDRVDAAWEHRTWLVPVVVVALLTCCIVMFCRDRRRKRARSQRVAAAYGDVEGVAAPSATAGGQPRAPKDEVPITSDATFFKRMALAERMEVPLVPSPPPANASSLALAMCDTRWPLQNLVASPDRGAAQIDGGAPESGGDRPEQAASGPLCAPGLARLGAGLRVEAPQHSGKPGNAGQPSGLLSYGACATVPYRLACVHSTALCSMGHRRRAARSHLPCVRAQLVPLGRGPRAALRRALGVDPPRALLRAVVGEGRGHGPAGQLPHAALPGRGWPSRCGGWRRSHRHRRRRRRRRRRSVHGCRRGGGDWQYAHRCQGCAGYGCAGALCACLQPPAGARVSQSVLGRRIAPHQLAACGSCGVLPGAWRGLAQLTGFVTACHQAGSAPPILLSRQKISYLKIDYGHITGADRRWPVCRAGRACCWRCTASATGCASAPACGAAARRRWSRAARRRCCSCRSSGAGPRRRVARQPPPPSTARTWRWRCFAAATSSLR
jgi:hypothetical protein